MAMAHRVAYLVKVYNIPLCLIINTNQIGVHLVPTGGNRTWETRGVKHVQVSWIEHKRQITIISTERSLLPLQVVFQKTTNHILPPMNHGRKQCSSIGFHLTYNSNYWSNLETTQAFVEHIFIPYKEEQVEKFALLEDRNMVWLIDCWLVHKSKKIMDWMKLKYPSVCIIFILANCTSVLQLVDVIL
jgi:hypothetical protein